MRKLKNEMAAVKDEVTGEMIEGGCDMVVDWIWGLCNMPFESGGVPEEGRTAVIVPLYNGKEERIECRSYRNISLLSEVGKIYARILVDRLRRVIEGFTDSE